MVTSPPLDTPAPTTLAQENAALRHAIALLHEVSVLLHRSLELEEACYAILTGVTAGVGLGFNRAMLFLAARDGSGLEGTMAVGPADRLEADRVWKTLEAGAADLQTLAAAVRGAHSPLDRQVRATKVPRAGTSLLSRALRRGDVTRAEPGDDDLEGLLDLDTGIAAPLTSPSGIVGVLYADNRFTRRPCEPVLEHVFSLVADHAGRAVENAQRFETVARAARTDALTGLGHHGALMERLTAELARARATSRPLSVVMLDLDDFKRVNDRLGHLAGDALLAGLAQRLAHHVRGDAQVFRYGGEEFTVVLPGADPRDALTIAERLRLAVAREPFPVADGRRLEVTCSVGVVTLGAETSVHAFVDAADQALLEAKRTGKNVVRVSASAAASR
ncbi:MAG: diguanylate cyclase [Myxococcota bacterium]